MKKFILSRTNRWLVYCLFLLLPACKKNNNDQSNAITVARVSGTYAITDMEVKVNNQQTDIYSQLTSCQKKDTYYLGADGTYRFSGSSDQNCTDEPNSGTWSLSGNIITINTAATGSSTLSISSLSSSQMVVTYNGPYSGATADFTTTLTRQ